MVRARVVFMALSMTFVLGFAGLLLAGRHAEEGLFRALGNLAEVVHLVETEYVDELNEEALELSLDAGIVESVDRSAAVVPGDRLDDFRRLVASPPPFGLVLASRLTSAAVRHTVAGSPAAAAGLEEWEVIERVDGVNTRGRPLWQIRLRLQRQQQLGERVALTVVDQRVDERREVVLVPRPWRPETVSTDDRSGVRLLKIHALPTGAATAVASRLEGAGAVVVDLRDLVWGLEEEALATADLFAADGSLGRWRGRRAGEKAFQATPARTVVASPVVVIGPDTENVGEILAEALRRAGATLVGERSAGHAPHMQLVHDRDLHLWMPVGYWLGAEEAPIHGRGIEPEEVVEETGGDEPLERALELARTVLGAAA